MEKDGICLLPHADQTNIGLHTDMNVQVSSVLNSGKKKTNITKYQNDQNQNTFYYIYNFIIIIIMMMMRMIIIIIIIY